MTDSNPSKEVMAKLAQASYQMGTKDLGRTKRLENTQNMVSDTDWIVAPDHTNSEITTYRHKNDPSNIVISHMGTKLNSKRGTQHLESQRVAGGEGSLGLVAGINTIGQVMQMSMEYDAVAANAMVIDVFAEHTVMVSLDLQSLTYSIAV